MRDRAFQKHRALKKKRHRNWKTDRYDNIDSSGTDRYFCDNIYSYNSRRQKTFEDIYFLAAVTDTKINARVDIKFHILQLIMTWSKQLKDIHAQTRH